MIFIGVNITCDTYECARKCAMKTIVSTQRNTTVSTLLKTILTQVSMGVCRGYETGTPVGCAATGVGWRTLFYGWYEAVNMG